MKQGSGPPSVISHASNQSTTNRLEYLSNSIDHDLGLIELDPVTAVWNNDDLASPSSWLWWHRQPTERPAACHRKRRSQQPGRHSQEGIPSRWPRPQKTSAAPRTPLILAKALMAASSPGRGCAPLFGLGHHHSPGKLRSVLSLTRPH